MEVDTPSEVPPPAPGAPPGEQEQGGGARSIFLHPLATITISDHYTRVSTGGGVLPTSAKILGVLFGERSGNELSIYDASEVGYDVQGEQIVLSQASVTQQKELYSAVYPTYEVLGWYSVGAEPSAADVHLQQQMHAHCADPLFLLLNPESAGAGGKAALPVVIFSAEQASGATVFVPGSFELKTAQAEQIGVEHVARSTPPEGTSAIERQATTMGTSLEALSLRVATLRRYLAAVVAGEVPPDHKLLRQISAVTSELRAMGGGGSGSGAGTGQQHRGDAFADALARDRCDALAVTALAALQKSAAVVESVAHKFSLAQMEHRATSSRRL